MLTNEQFLLAAYCWLHKWLDDQIDISLEKEKNGRYDVNRAAAQGAIEAYKNVKRILTVSESELEMMEQKK